MCGVFGYIGPKPCRDLIFEGLSRLEYRGYDSAGIALLKEKSVHVLKQAGKLKDLQPRLGLLPSDATRGLGHTRWATHGAPIDRNAHPHVSERLAIIHNGIIENYADLKNGLLASGIDFSSDTDSEVVLHLLERELSKNGSMREALANLSHILRGAYSLGVAWTEEPDALYVVKQGSPMVVAKNETECFFASDVAAFLKHTKTAYFLEDGQIARLAPGRIECWSFGGVEISLQFSDVDLDETSVEKQGYPHFMLKEVFEQPAALGRMIGDFFSGDGEFRKERVKFGTIDFSIVERVHLVGCGTAYLAGMVGAQLFEETWKMPATAELASEFRYREPYLDRHSLVIAITQSGETMDTLESVKHAKRMGSQTFAVTNGAHSSIARECHAHLLMGCGPEIGVASTKAFTAMLLSQLLIVRTQKEMPIFSELEMLPGKIQAVLALSSQIQRIAESFYESRSFLFVGRGLSYAIAVEGALKLKEISYIHAEGYAAGELKHGPIALVDKDMPVFAIAPKDRYYEKSISNIEQVHARAGRVIGLLTEHDANVVKFCQEHIVVPSSSNALLQAIINVIPLQLFAYYTALRRGTDVDQPRNLAKSVTVE